MEMLAGSTWLGKRGGPSHYLCRGRLKSVVSHMADRLNEPESRFHASLVTNVFDLVDLLPQLNVGQDQELNRFAAEIRNRLWHLSGARAEEEQHPPRSHRQRCRCPAGRNGYRGAAA